MKMHNGVDAESGLIHGVVCTAANEADVVHAHELLHGQESQVHGDSGYTRLERRDEIKAAQGEGRQRKDIDWRIAMKRGQAQAMPEGPAKALYEWFERRKAQVRAIVEHTFHVIKNLFGYRKVSYRGIAKNEARAKAHAALANLYVARRRLMAQGVSVSAPPVAQFSVGANTRQSGDGASRSKGSTEPARARESCCMLRMSNG